MYHGVFSILAYTVFNHLNGGVCIFIYDRLFESLQWSEIAPVFSFMLWHMLDFCLKRITYILENRSSIKSDWQFSGPLHLFIHMQHACLSGQRGGSTGRLLIQQLCRENAACLIAAVSIVLDGLGWRTIGEAKLFIFLDFQAKKRKGLDLYFKCERSWASTLYLKCKWDETLPFPSRYYQGSSGSLA